MKVIVCGGGVMGAATAFFLARRGVAATVVERTGVAAGASGKSGGFLAQNWCDGTPLEPLARRSFMLHAALAAEGFADWGYRRLTTFAGSYDALAPRLNEQSPPSWLTRDVFLERRIGIPATTAQIDPAAFTNALMDAAEASGATLVHGAVGGLEQAPDGKVTGVVVDGQILRADAVVIAMGPWSLNASVWLPIPAAVHGVKGHSLVFDTANIPAEAIFLDVRTGTGVVETPEIFPRPDGTTYVCAISRDGHVPDDPAQVAPDEGAFEQLAEICELVSPALVRDSIIARQVCYRPVTPDGMPLIGVVPGSPGAYIATGHGVWGMLTAPATGEAMAELLIDGDTHAVDIADFDPARLMPIVTH